MFSKVHKQTQSSGLYWISCVCDIGSYEFTISEDIGIGKPSGRVKANDRDIGENAKSTYNIIAGDEKDVFEIVTDPQTQDGILTLKKVGIISLLRIKHRNIPEKNI